MTKRIELLGRPESAFNYNIIGNDKCECEK